MNPLNHFDTQGQAHMVDVGQKSDSERIACAIGQIKMSAAAFAHLDPQHNKKGDVLGIARIAAIQACKQTPHLIPRQQGVMPLVVNFFNLFTQRFIMRHEGFTTADMA
jgi:molybdenum cofactor biosynthesis enzyme